MVDERVLCCFERINSYMVCLFLIFGDFMGAFQVSVGNEIGAFMRKFLRKCSYFLLSMLQEYGVNYKVVYLLGEMPVCFLKKRLK